jgi:hypothetical protein
VLRRSPHSAWKRTAGLQWYPDRIGRRTRAGSVTDGCRKRDGRARHLASGRARRGPAPLRSSQPLPPRHRAAERKEQGACGRSPSTRGVRRLILEIGDSHQVRPVLLGRWEELWSDDCDLDLRAVNFDPGFCTSITPSPRPDARKAIPALSSARRTCSRVPSRTSRRLDASRLRAVKRLQPRPRAFPGSSQEAHALPARSER